jgi:aldehyde dehydrogenase (NAD+)
MEKFKMYIDGEFVEAASGKWFDSYNPFTGKVWSQVAEGGAEDVDRAVKAAHRAFSEGSWPDMTASQRGMLVHRLGDLIARDAKKLAEMEVQDNGKLIAEMQGQVNYVPQWFYYYGGLADKVQGAVIPLDKKGYFNFDLDTGIRQTGQGSRISRRRGQRCNRFWARCRRAAHDASAGEKDLVYRIGYDRSRN